MRENMILAVLVFLPILGGLIGWIIGQKNEKYRDRTAIGVVVLEFLLMLSCFSGFGGGIGTEAFLTFYIPEICGFGLSFTLDGFRLVYGTVAAFMWMMTSVFSNVYMAHSHSKNRYVFFQ